MSGGILLGRRGTHQTLGKTDVKPLIIMNDDGDITYSLDLLYVLQYLPFLLLYKTMFPCGPQ